jgi:ABC-type phosphate transport system substrate-binding protein
MIAMYDGSSSTAGLQPSPAGVLIYSVVAHAGLVSGKNITPGELRKIFIKPGEPNVVAVGRRGGSGSRQAFNVKVLSPQVPSPADKGNCPSPNGSAYHHTSCTEDSTADVLSFVNGTPNAIGYAEVREVHGSLAGYPHVSVISIDNAAPTAGNVRDGSYSFWTVEHLYAGTQLTALAKDFLGFLPNYIESNPQPDFIACSGVPGLTANC